MDASVSMVLNDARLVVRSTGALRYADRFRLRRRLVDELGLDRARLAEQRLGLLCAEQVVSTWDDTAFSTMSGRELLRDATAVVEGDGELTSGLHSRYDTLCLEIDNLSVSEPDLVHAVAAGAMVATALAGVIFGPSYLDTPDLDDLDPDEWEPAYYAMSALDGATEITAFWRWYVDDGIPAAINQATTN